MKIEFLNEAPKGSQAIFLSRDLVKKIGCIMVDDVAFVFSGESASAVEPEHILCSLGEPKSTSKTRKPAKTKSLNQMDLIRMRRDEALSLTDFGRKLGINAATLATIETFRPVRASTVRKMENMLGLSLDMDILTDPASATKELQNKAKKLRKEAMAVVCARAGAEGWESR